MNFGKCLFYGIVIGILIIILIKLCKSIKENFEESKTEEIKEEIKEDIKEEIKDTNETNESLIDKVKDVAISAKDKVVDTTINIKDAIVNTGSTITDKITNTVSNVIDKINPDETEEPTAITQDKLDNVIEAPAEVDAIDTEGISEDLNGLPKFINKETSNVMDGVKMIPQPTINAWQDVYMNEDNDNSFMIDLGGRDKKTNKDQGSGRFTDRSPACCSPQYPLPFKIPVDEEILKNAKDFVPNPYMGNNNWMNAGCTCMKKVNANKLAVRGGNA